MPLFYNGNRVGSAGLAENRTDRERERGGVKETGGGGEGREELIKLAGKYRRTTFIFSALIIQLGTSERSFVSVAFANKDASGKCACSVLVCLCASEPG